MVVADDDDDVGASWRAGVQGRTGRADASHRRRRADCMHGGTGPGRRRSRRRGALSGAEFSHSLAAAAAAAARTWI